MLALAAATACSQCSKPSTPTDPITPKVDRPDLEVSALPTAPVIDATGMLPGVPQGPLAVVVARPQEEVRGNERPTLTFNKPVVPLGAVDAELPVPATITPAVKGEWKWIGSAAVEFVPAEPFAYATTFTVTVQPALKAIDGQALKEPFSFSFSTLAPALDRSEPRDGWNWLDSDEPLKLTLNQPVKNLEAAKLTVDDKPVKFTVAAGVDIDEEQAKKAGRQAKGRTPWGRPTRYELKLPKLPLGARVSLAFDGVVSTEGTLPNQIETLSFRARPAMQILEATTCDGDGDCPTGPVRLRTTNEIDHESLAGRVHLKRVGDDKELAIDIDEVWSSSNDYGSDDSFSTRLAATLRPGSAYELVVDAGVADLKGQKAAAFTAKLKTSDVRPWLSYASPFVLLEKNGDGALPIESANLTTAQVSILPLSVSALARALSASANARALAMPAETSFALPAERNVFARTPLPIRPALPAGEPQLFAVTVRNTSLSKEKPWPTLGQITDLAAHAKLGATGSVVWVTSLSTGKPVSGATVAVYSEAGDKKGEWTTDADGLARFPGLIDVLGKGSDSDDSWHTPFALVAASKDGDTGVTLSTWNDSDYSTPRAWDGDIADVNVVMFAERGIYRPGDEVMVKGVVRQRVRGAMSVPKAGSAFRLAVRDGNGKALKEEKVALSKFGTFSAKVTLPADAPLGWWSVGAEGTVAGRNVGGNAGFRVEQYRAPQFKVDVQAPTAPVISGDALSATVNARYLFGAPMPGAEVEATVTRETTSFYAEGESSFDFGINTWWWDDNDPMPSADVFARNKGVIAADGSFAVDVGAVAAASGRTWVYTVEAEVKDVSRQAVANRASVVVHPANVYAGVRVAGGFGEVGKESVVDVIATDVAGKRKADVDVAVAIKRREWKNVKKKSGGHYEQVSEASEVDVTTCKLTTKSDVVTCRFVPEKPGLHVVEATATDSAGRTQKTKTSFYVSGDGWVSWQRSDDDRLELVADKKVYAPGDKARVIIKSPWPTAEAIVTTEREGVRSVKRYTLKGSANAVDVDVTEDAVPNVFVSAVLVRGRVDDKAVGDVPKGEVDPARPQVKIGTLNLTVERTHKRLDIAVDAGAGTKRPGQKVQLKLAVTDHNKKGVPAEVTIWAVDEAVLRLTDYQPPDLLSAFHPQRGSSVRFGEPLIHLVKKQAYGMKGDPGGGGGDSGSGFRSNFKTTALFVPDVVTDGAGNAVVDVTLPDDLTTYRIMAVAVADDRFGSGKGELVVQKPVMALPALPRVVRVGDRFEAGVVVHAAVAGDVVVTADGDGVVIDGDKQKTVTLSGKGQEVRFTFHADVPGPATFLFKAVQGTETDGVKMTVPVLLPVVIETTAVSGAAGGGAADKVEEALAPPGASRDDVGGLEVTLGSTALAGYQEAMKQLVDYPHGCLEQQSSRLLPFMALRELQGTFGEAHKGGSDAEVKQLTAWLGDSVLDKNGTPEPDKVITRTLASLTALQDSDGGFFYWASSSCTDPWASSYASLALARAQGLGYPVKNEVVDNALRYLEEKVLADQLPQCGWWSTTRHATTAERVFAAFVLARAGKPKTAMLSGIVNQVLAKPDSEALFVRAMLADALVVGRGDPATAQKVLQTVLNAARETPREVHFEEADGARYQSYWSSDVRTSAIVLMTLTDAVPEHPFIPKIAQFLQTARLKNGQYRNTQEAAFALLALAEVARTKEKAPPAFDGVVSLGGAPLVTQNFTGRSLDVTTKLVPMKDVLAKGTANLPFTFEKKGQGTLYYTAILRRAPAVLPENAVDQGFIVQRWFEPIDLVGKQAKSFYAGDLVRVRVRVATRDARRYVAVDVPLPSGLEAVDTSLASTARAGGNNDDTAGDEDEGDDGDGDDGEGDGEAYGFWSPFTHSEKRDERVSYYADDLPPGVHMLSFVARATTMGSFVLPPAEASEMYAPEVFGRSDAGTFQVVP